MRYSTAYSHGGYEESWKEMIMDWNRLWVRNLVRYLCDNMISQGRDDRCIAEHGRELRTPFLDEDVSSFLHSCTINNVRIHVLLKKQLLDFSMSRGMGDKLILRKIASVLKLDFCLSLSKRAIQFGSRIVKYS